MININLKLLIILFVRFLISIFLYVIYGYNICNDDNKSWVNTVCIFIIPEYFIIKYFYNTYYDIDIC